MIKEPIKILDRVILIDGRVSWTDHRQRIDLKKPIKNLIGDIHEVRYIMELCLTKEKLMERAEELMEESIMPVLLYFIREEAK